ncbi:MAG TPA: hypothetical protein VMU29_00570 [Smithella sp.]|nr:hypothetical protein [Smithella sp.]
MMKKNKLIDSIKKMVPGFCALALINCAGFGTIINMPAVKNVPAGPYERIIKLNNPAAAPDRTFAGLVFIKKGAKICTDSPREEIIKSLDELTVMEKNSVRYFSNYKIEADGRIYGFVSIPVEYNAMLWKNEKDENCKYKVQITWLGEENNGTGDEVPKSGYGGGHGGGHGGGFGH